MISIVVDTSTPTLLFSIVENNEIKYLYNSKTDGDFSSNFMVIVSNAFNETNIKPNDVNKIFISTGPGSFTGIRIGMTFAKVFAYSLKKDLIPFSTLELFASSSSSKNIISVIDARRDYVYRGIYDDSLNCIEQDKYISLNCLKDEIKSFKNYSVYSYDSFSDINSIIPNINVLKLVNKHIDDKPVNPHELKPSYLKMTEAEEKILNDKKNQ